MMLSFRKLAAVSRIVVACATVSLCAVSAYAEQSTSPEKLKLAAEEFDSGRRAYKMENYEQAAHHFENAFRDAPAAPALRLAIISWEKAGGLARAATLAVRAQGLYPDDDRTIELAQSVLKRVSSKLGKVTITCHPACMLSLDRHLVDENEVSEGVFFAEPGEHVLQTGWSEGRVKSEKFVAKASKSLRFDFEAPPIPKKTKDADGAAGDSSKGMRVDGSSSRKASPMLFWLGTGVVGVFAGLTIWSGIDTLSNPGPDRVKEECVGQGESCSLYQDGLSNQRRTNYLLVGTAIGAVSVGVIGGFFTDWGDDDKPTTKTSTTVVPMLGSRGTFGAAARGTF